MCSFSPGIRAKSTIVNAFRNRLHSVQRNIGFVKQAWIIAK
jgi:hypothetical protein